MLGYEHFEFLLKRVRVIAEALRVIQSTSQALKYSQKKQTNKQTAIKFNSVNTKYRGNKWIVRIQRNTNAVREKMNNDNVNNDLCRRKYVVNDSYQIVDSLIKNLSKKNPVNYPFEWIT